jgi:hypothetical protein
MHHRSRRRAEENHEENCGANRQTRNDNPDQNRTQQRVQDDEPPGLVIQVGRCDAECTLEAHPLTPEAATPATK